MAATGRTMRSVSARWRFAAARIGLGDIAGFVPDVVHGHDWQAGLAMAYLAYQDQPSAGDRAHGSQPRLSGSVSA